MNAENNISIGEHQSHPSTSRTADLEAERAKITATLIATGSKGCTIEEFESFYRDDWDSEIPFEKFGFNSCRLFLEAFPQECRLISASSGALYVKVCANEETKSILSLVDRTDPLATDHFQKTERPREQLNSVASWSKSVQPVASKYQFLPPPQFHLPPPPIIHPYVPNLIHSYLLMPLPPPPFYNELIYLPPPPPLFVLVTQPMAIPIWTVIPTSKPVPSITCCNYRASNQHPATVNLSRKRFHKTRAQKLRRSRGIQLPVLPASFNFKVTFTGYHLQTALQERIYNAVWTELRIHLHVSRLVRHFELMLDMWLTLPTFNFIFNINASTIKDVFGILFGELVLVVPGIDFRLAYLGNDGIVSRRYEDFLAFIHKRRKLTIEELFEQFRIREPEKVSAVVLARILRVNFSNQNCMQILKQGLPNHLVNMSELEGCENQWNSLRRCRVAWIGKE